MHIGKTNQNFLFAVEQGIIATVALRRYDEVGGTDHQDNKSHICHAEVRLELQITLSLMKL